MALIKLGALAQDVRGSLNGTTFSRNTSGAYVRTKVSPVQPITEANTAAKLYFKTLSQMWSSILTAENRADWNAFAAVHPVVNVFGDSIILSGIAFFQLANRRLLQIGFDPLISPPPTWDTTNPGTLAVVAEVTGTAISTLTITTGTSPETNESLYVFGTPPILGARSVQQNDLRLVSGLGDTIQSGVDFSARYVARFAPLTWAVGDRFAMTVQILNSVTGATGTPVLVQVTTVAP